MVGPVTVSVTALDVPPPGAGVKTVIAAGPPVARSAAVSCAVSCVADPNVVGRAVPFTCTTELPANPDPVAVSVKAPPPTATLVGLILVSVGTGGGGVTVSVAPLDVPPPGAGLNTVMVGVPVLATSAARIAAVTWVAVPKLVVRGTPLTCTTAPATKPVPVTVNVNAGLPAARLAGFNAVMVGTGLLTVTSRLVASWDELAPEYHRTLQVVPGVAAGGTVKCSVAPVRPVAGATCESLKYFQSI